MGNVIVNGKVYNCDGNISIIDDKVYCNGKLIVDPTEIHAKKINIEITGNVDKLKSSAGNINIIGDCNNVMSTSGDITIKGNISGNVNTTSGDVKCGQINGNVSTVSGDVIKRNYAIF